MDNSYRRFRDELSVPFSRVKKLGLVGCPETSVRNYHYTQRNIPEERRSHLRGGSPKLSTVIAFRIAFYFYAYIQYVALKSINDNVWHVFVEYVQTGYT